MNYLKIGSWEELVMKICKKVIGVVMAMLMLFSMAACGSKGEGTPTEGGKATPEEAVKAAQAKMQEVKSLESEMIMDMAMSSGEQNLKMKTNANMVTFEDPMKLKMTMIMDVGEELGGIQKMEMYADEVDGNTTLYMNMMDTWYKQSIPAEQLSEYDTQESMDTYLDGSSALKEVGTEQVNGADATRYDGIISGDALKETMETSGALENLRPMLESANMQAEEIYKDLKDISVSIWIDTEGYPVKCEMDMTDMMQSLMTKVMEASGATEEQNINVDTMKVSITSKNFNNATDFEIPEEAKNAVEM